MTLSWPVPIVPMGDLGLTYLGHFDHEVSVNISIPDSTVSGHLGTMPEIIEAFSWGVRVRTRVHATHKIKLNDMKLILQRGHVI